jgi:hypothetical protein
MLKVDDVWVELPHPPMDGDDRLEVEVRLPETRLREGV